MAVVMAVAVLAVACSSDSPATTVGEMRPVPTVPPTPAPGDEIAATVPAPTGPVTTELVGDPRPDPDSQATLPPLPELPAFDACARLVEFGVADQLAGSTGGAPVTEAVGERGCRLAAGAAVAEIHYLSEDVLGSDWFRRDDIEPVGDVGADAVGLAVFVVPGGASEAGYTIALVSRRQGAVVAVRGAGEDRAVAVELANTVSATM
jgi:hypothetical protein